MPVKALMVDVDGVLVDGRPEDGRHWQTSVEQEFGFPLASLHEHFFAPHWDNIVVGRAGLLDHLTAALQTIAPHVSASQFIAYWFGNDARLNTSLLHEMAHLRSQGIRIYLATNQEHLRAAYLMNEMGLAAHVDGIYHSAGLGAKKPDPEFFAKVQAAVGLPASDLLLIDDSAPNVQAAIKAGWQAHHWTPQSQPGILRDLCV